MSGAIAWWAELYRTNDIVQLLAAFGHILAILYAARYALRGDRAALRLTRPDGRFERTRVRDLRQITGAHVHVITGLGFALLTGVAQLLAQLHYLPQSPIFWIKMTMIALLLANGRVIQVAGGRAAAVIKVADAPGSAAGAVGDGAGGPAALRGLRTAALRSIALWCTLVVLGLLLTTVRPS